MFFLENRLSDINVIYIKIQSKTSHYSNFNENKQMPSKKTPKSPGKGGKVRTPPKSTPTGQEAFPSLELTDEAVKAQYRLFVTELEQSKVREAAEAIWKQNDSPASPDSDKIYDHIKGLSAILPVYLEGLLGLCDEERGDVVPLAWWRKYVKTIDEAWFATMFPRLPQESFSRTHDAEYYDLDNEDWMQRAALFILQGSITLLRLLATRGTPEEKEEMDKEIELDELEIGRRGNVYEWVANHRLGATDEGKDESRSEVQKVFADPDTLAQHQCSLSSSRLHYTLQGRCLVVPDDGADYDVDAMVRMAVLNGKIIRKVMDSVEILQGSVAMLTRDMKSDTKTTTNPAVMIPAWVLDCDALARNLSMEDGMKFGEF